MAGNQGLEGFAEELTLSVDRQTGEYTRLTRFHPDADTADCGARSHPYAEEVFIVSGRLKPSTGGWSADIMPAARPVKSMDRSERTRAASFWNCHSRKGLHPRAGSAGSDVAACKHPRRIEFEHGILRDWCEGDIADLVEFANRRSI